MPKVQLFLCFFVYPAMKFTAFSLLAAMVFSTVNAVTVPGADTPSFYLVASSTDPAANLLVCQNFSFALKSTRYLFSSYSPSG
jgi:hypothetical protein